MKVKGNGGILYCCEFSSGKTLTIMMHCQCNTRKTKVASDSVISGQPVRSRCAIISGDVSDSLRPSLDGLKSHTVTSFPRSKLSYRHADTKFVNRFPRNDRKSLILLLPNVVNVKAKTHEMQPILWAQSTSISHLVVRMIFAVVIVCRQILWR